ncbi:MAG: arginine N-succinyltransferase [Deltaproteobacteria bacterium]|nr:arginine N-succinyltransferase [Deltaproteobacteria bacterium]
MPFRVRSADFDDLQFLYRLAQQASLISLPPDPEALMHILRKSHESFSNLNDPENAEYVFVLEDTTTQEIIGESLVYAQYASSEHPYYYFSVIEKIFTDVELGKTITHPVLRLEAEKSPFSLTGGLILDNRYRGHPKKLGNLIALTRFVYMGMFPERFHKQVLSEVVAPLDENGGNPFWEAVGSKLTGLSFEEFLALNRQKKTTFIGNLFPSDDIYLCFLTPDLWPSRERVRKGVGHFARHIIETVGFQYLNRAHLHGGPILGANLENINVIKKGAFYRTDIRNESSLPIEAFLGSIKKNRFYGGKFPCAIESQTVFLPEFAFRLLCLEKEEEVFVSPVD